jgi:hypothetical protein
MAIFIVVATAQQINFAVFVYESYRGAPQHAIPVQRLHNKLLLLPACPPVCCPEGLNLHLCLILK